MRKVSDSRSVHSFPDYSPAGTCGDSLGILDPNCQFAMRWPRTRQGSCGAKQKIGPSIPFDHEYPPLNGGYSWYIQVVIKRQALLLEIRKALRRSRVVALLGPRQSGKTTLARELVPGGSARYFDLGNPRSLARLEEPQIALEGLRGVVAIDSVPAVRATAPTTPPSPRSGIAAPGRKACCGWANIAHAPDRAQLSPGLHSSPPNAYPGTCQPMTL